MASKASYRKDDLENFSYRHLQKLAKGMRLPSKMKKVNLIDMIHARNNKDEAKVTSIINQIKAERQESKRRSQLSNSQIEMNWKVEDLSPNKNNGILRQIIEEGTGYGTPNVGDLVTVEMEGQFQLDGKVFDTRTVTFVLGEGSELEICEGIERALKKFLIGEKSKVTIEPRYGFTSEGCAGFGVPPNAVVEYLVKLVDFEKLKDTSRSMDIDKNLEQSKIHNQKAYDYFKESKYRLSIEMFKKELNLLESGNEDTALTEENKVIVNHFLLSVHLNLAIVYLKVVPVRYIEARDHASKALKIHPYNVKGLFRRGQALLGLGDAEQALKDFQKMLEVEPQSKVAANRIKICQSTIQNRKEKMFAKHGNEEFEMKSPNATTSAETDSVYDSLEDSLNWTNEPKNDISLLYQKKGQAQEPHARSPCTTESVIHENTYNRGKRHTKIRLNYEDGTHSYLILSHSESDESEIENNEALPRIQEDFARLHVDVVPDANTDTDLLTAPNLPDIGDDALPIIFQEDYPLDSNSEYANTDSDFPTAPTLPDIGDDTLPIIFQEDYPLDSNSEYAVNTMTDMNQISSPNIGAMVTVADTMEDNYEFT